MLTDADADGAGPQAAAQLWTAYRGDNAWADFTGAGVLQTRYLFGLGMDSLIARTNAAGAVGWYLTDNLGSVRQVVTTGGAVLYAANYSAFGQVRSATGTGGDRFGYTGRELSGITGEMYYRARYYDPASGRFLGQDPIGYNGGNTNLYGFVLNAPLNLVDPTGLEGVSPYGPTGKEDYRKAAKEEPWYMPIVAGGGIAVVTAGFLFAPTVVGGGFFGRTLFGGGAAAGVNADKIIKLQRKLDRARETLRFWQQNAEHTPPGSQLGDLARQRIIGLKGEIEGLETAIQHMK